MPLELTPKQPPYYDVVAASTGTKYYTAIINQTGTAIPTATILQNTLSATPTWSRTAAGVYFLTLTDAFTTNKTAILWGNGGGDPEMNMNYFLPNNDQIEFGIYLAGGLSDDCLSNATLQIIIYP